LKDVPDCAPWYETLALFAHGTYADYKANKAKYPDLSAPLLKKLKQLSLVSIASVQKSIPYSLLLDQLDLSHVRQLEDLIIDCMYAGLIGGKLDQKEQRFQVDRVMGRDIRPGQVKEMIQVLGLWAETSEALERSIKEKIAVSTFMHEQHQRQNKEFEERVEEIKVSIKAMEAEMGEYEGGVPPELAAEMAGANKAKGRPKNKNKGHDQPYRRR